jgi:excisionase family DNA binding protein
MAERAHIDQPSLIIGPSLIVPAELAGLLADLLEAHVRRWSVTEPAVLHLAHLARQVARWTLLPLSAADGMPRVTEPTVPWLTISEAAAVRGQAPRTVRQMAVDGRLPAQKRGTQWLVQLPPSPPSTPTG